MVGTYVGWGASDGAVPRYAGALPCERNAHFREQDVDGRLRFDYRLREGPCPTTNALLIRADAGLPVEPPADDVG